jgi:hypothetical protein
MGGGAIGATGGGGGGAITGGGGGGGAITGGGGGGGSGADGIPYGPPAQTGSLGMLMHCVSDGPVGLMESYGLPRHSASSGVAAQEGSSGPVGCAFAGTVAPAVPMSAAATTVFVTQLVIRRWWHVPLSIRARNKF